MGFVNREISGTCLKNLGRYWATSNPGMLNIIRRIALAELGMLGGLRGKPSVHDNN